MRRRIRPEHASERLRTVSRQNCRRWLAATRSVECSKVPAGGGRTAWGEVMRRPLGAEPDWRKD